jgi:5-formaminoimidazole-4-carboxamide-1-beta-D-ribofuranosyl 5'-monophosphate synthetase
MAILEFAETKEMEKWGAEYIDPKRYMVVTTVAREIIVKPTKSTKNLDTGYFVATSIEKVNEIAKKFQENGFFLLTLRNYVWDETKGPNGGGIA